MTAEEYLKNISKMICMVDVISRDIEVTRRRLYSISGVDPAKDKVKVGSGDLSDKLIAFGGTIDRLEKKGIKLIERIENAKQMILGMRNANGDKDMELQTFLINYYVLGQGINGIQKSMAISRATAYRRKEAALMMFEENYRNVLDSMEGVEPW